MLFAYARTGAALVMNKPTSHHTSYFPRLIVSSKKPAEREKMSVAAKAFSRPDAADKIAREVIELALEHEQSGGRYFSTPDLDGPSFV